MELAVNLFREALGSAGGAGHDHRGLVWWLGRLRPVAMLVALAREVAHLALDHPRPGAEGENAAWLITWRRAMCRLRMNDNRSGSTSLPSAAWCMSARIA